MPVQKRLRIGLYLRQTGRPGEREPHVVPSTGFQSPGGRSLQPSGTRQDSNSRSRLAEPGYTQRQPTPPPLTPSQRGDVICLISRGRSFETLPPTTSAPAAWCRHQCPTCGDAIRPGLAGGGKGLRAGRASAGLELKA
uniref:Uncharacterized protein n=1 Tax=Pipistrellus kuhlii TaxID=59472 RepID=A0A7J7Y935_PIPKU|nr:hypothetical protein mPipKuh1_010296 [Pipistrellus kuhlii]